MRLKMLFYLGFCWCARAFLGRCLGRWGPGGLAKRPRFVSSAALAARRSRASCASARARGRRRAPEDAAPGRVARGRCHPFERSDAPLERFAYAAVCSLVPGSDSSRVPGSSREPRLVAPDTRYDQCPGGCLQGKPEADTHQSQWVNLFWLLSESRRGSFASSRTIEGGSNLRQVDPDGVAGTHERMTSVCTTKVPTSSQVVGAE